MNEVYKELVYKVYKIKMDKKSYNLILQSALLYFEGVKKEDLINRYKIDSRLVKEGIKVCDFILNEEYQEKYDREINSKNCAKCGVLLSKEEKKFFTIDNKSFCQKHYNEVIKFKREANETLDEIEK